MGFWIFMFIMVLLIPLTMIGFGKLFLKAAPKEINYAFGYRTNMSMKNKDTWEFAHNYCGGLWYRGGIIVLVITIAAMLCVLGKSEDTIGAVGGTICGFQLIPLMGPIIPTEIALKKTFDKNGKRKGHVN